MACERGYHQHLGAKGKMLACHPETAKHKNAKTRQYHDLAVAGKGDKFEEFGEEYEDEKDPIIPKESSEKIKQNATVIKAYLKQLTKNKALLPLLVPLAGALYGYEKTMKQVKAYKEKAKSKKEKEMADAYAKTVEEIVDSVPDAKDVDLDSMTEDDIKAFEKNMYAMKSKHKKRIDELKEIIKKKGKTCPEYAMYRAYKDYFDNCDGWIDKAEAKLNPDKAKGGKNGKKYDISRFSEEIGTRKVSGVPSNAPTGVGGQAPSMYQ